MKKNNKFIRLFLALTLCYFINDISVYAEDQKDDKTFYYLAAGTGIEYLAYSEHESDSGISTDTSIYNVVTKFEASMNPGDLFFSIKGILPVYLRSEKEEWRRSGSVYQTNNLKYTWTRIDVNAGYRFYSWMNPCLGLRWSKSRHKRNNFFLNSEPVSSEATETNEALFVSAGFKGDIKSSLKWKFQYSVEYFMPISSRTENSALSGWKSGGEEGYSIGAGGVARYLYSPSVSFYLELSGEREYRDGSDWIDYPGGSAKWPENETTALGCTIGIVRFF